MPAAKVYRLPTRAIARNCPLAFRAIGAHNRRHPPSMNRFLTRRVGLALLCGAIGLALNLWRTGSTAPMMLGRIVTLPIAILYGPWLGALAAAIPAVAGRGVFAVSIVLLPVEAAVIGMFARRGRSPLLGGVLIWSAVAAVLVARPQLYGLGFMRATILEIALQMVISGLVAVVIADLIATGASARRLVAQATRQERRLQGYAFHA